MPNLLRNLVVFAALSACAISRGADTSQFDAANRLYEAGNFSGAKQAYGQLAKTGPWSANLFYNLGNAEWKLGNSGEAAADYERALILDPSHPEARANLDFVRDQTGAKWANLSWWEQALSELDPNAASILLTISCWGAFFCLAVILLRSKGRTGPVITLTLLLLVAAYSAGCLWESDTQATRAVVIAKSVEARVAPAEVAPVADTLPAGSEVLSPEDRGQWTYCTLPDGAPAWIPSDALEKVNPA
ncbi:MAG: tetratricopeptide repeat protein [Chthoniobacteraceae bacterium]|jgi:tetratricopeptide (TPR) repeat protein